LSQHLVPRDSESPAAPPQKKKFRIGLLGDGKKCRRVSADPVTPKLAPSLRQWLNVKISLEINQIKRFIR